MHDGDRAGGALEPLGCDAEDAVVLPQARDESLFHPLELKTQHVQHVRPLDRFFDASKHFHAELFDAARHQCPRPADGDFRAELGQAPEIRPGDARVQHVADEADLEAFDLAVLVTNREQVEQRLRRMLVLAVSRIDDVGRDAIAKEFGGPGGGVTDHDHIDPHRFEIARRVDQRFPLRHGRARRCNVDRIGREPLFGELERHTSARRGFEEEIDDRFAPQRGHFLDGPFRDFLERLGGIEDEPDLLRRHVLETGEVFAETHRTKST